MSKIKIICDSACDITQEEAKKLGIRVLPLTTRFEDGEYQDGVTITPHEFFEKMANSKNLPQTSQLTPIQIQTAVEEELKENDEVIFITLSSQISGTYNNACIIAEDIGSRMKVIDSANATGGIAVSVQYAVNLANEGKTADEIVELVNKNKSRIRLFGLLDTLDNLKKGGRISAVAAAIGNILAIKPIITFEDGQVKVKAKGRGAVNGRMVMRDLVNKTKGIDLSMPVWFNYGGTSDALVREFMEKNKDLLDKDPSEYPVNCIGAAIGTHIGPNSIAITYFEKE